jgi:hypothetical protein
MTNQEHRGGQDLACIGKCSNAKNIFGWEHNGKNHLYSPRSRWRGNIVFDLMATVSNDMELICTGRSCENGNELPCSINFREFREYQGD